MVRPVQPPVISPENNPLVDLDCRILDPNVEFNLFDVYNCCYGKSVEKSDKDIPIWESNLPRYIVPLTHSVPDFIRLCQAYYMPEKRCIVNKEKETLFYITEESINSMLQMNHDPNSASLSIEDLTQLYLDLEFNTRFKIYQNFCPNQVDIPKLNPPFDTVDFPDETRQIVSMLSFILGYASDEFTDVAILGFLSTLNPGQSPSIQFNFAKCIAENMHYQLSKLSEEGVFRYSSYLLHLFLYYQTDKFPIECQKVDAEGKVLSVVFWSSILRKWNKEYSFTDFNDSFIAPAMYLLEKEEIPRINDETRRILQLSESYKTGDWYLYKNHTEIRVYGSSLAPYKLPRFVTTRIFSLEYLRQLLNVDEIHFIAFKKKTQFKLKNQIGPFIVNNREAANEINVKLKEYKFPCSFTWKYDPQGILSAIRVKCKLPVYLHDPKPHIERYVNKIEWEPNTLSDDDSQAVQVIQVDSGKGKQIEQTVQVAYTSKDTDNVHKRDREGDSFIAETIEDIKFRTPYSKRSKSTEEEKDKAVNIDIDDEATRIVTQTLKELQNVKIGTQ